MEDYFPGRYFYPSLETVHLVASVGDTGSGVVLLMFISSYFVKE